MRKMALPVLTVAQWLSGRSRAPAEPAERNDHESLVAALEHAQRWYEHRLGLGLQILNFYLVSIAVMAAAYVGALQAKLDAVAGAIGVISAMVSLAAAIAGWRQRSLARLALQPLAELQDRLATASGVASLRMLERNPRRMTAMPVSLIMFTIACAISITGTLYAWLR
ncbi:hypothetical protein [Nonomuraea soli]|uniref:Membrane associated rhomboid family serine protease n=1 Tax=Nonomuraea soli TaxID=1032476 RepID=A0A7W0CGX0_9ACTN|nr:hypothetical protein [Nonomuraea soli]MBA2890777.1 membrane associated rhomboid family serine protease [Nonomuraea soli]